MRLALENIDQARALLVEEDDVVVNPLATLGAAAFAATAALAMAGVMVLGPSLMLDQQSAVAADSVSGV